MATEFYNADDPFNVAFAVDADLVWGETQPFQITKRKVEGSGSIADFIASLPRTANVEGRITAMNLPGATPDPQKLSNARDALQALADKCQPVLVLSGIYAGYLGIERTEVNISVDGGKALTARVNLTRIETTEVGTANVPASKLRAKVKRKAAAGKKGGAAKGSKPPDNRTLSAKLVDGLGGLFGR
jgi:hypothetical protein